MTGTLYVISAPSGAGKTSLVKELLETTENLGVSISHTTRPIRPDEVEGVNYHFINLDQFQHMLGTADFMEHAEVFKNFYGTSKTEARHQLAQGKDVILEIDWQGAQQIRRQLPESIGIFILPPSRDALEQRLQGRGQDSEEIIQYRLSQATDEISHYVEYDYLVINDDFQTALNELRAIVEAKRLEIKPQSKQHQELIQNLLS